MKLSVIIVNYNVRAYLEQCLRTVFEALKDIEGDVFVVDNQSTDGSVEMVREKFPQAKVIANAENVGFSRANNQAIRASDAEYVLLLNPDTVVGEDVFRKVIDFMDAHPRAGGLGVKMIDGTGKFLPESKRGLPTPAVAFWKIIGLTRLFPRSREFGRYHLGHLEENEAAPIEILSGACMFLRKKTLDEVGLLDESFFMYGEDIDLSYRITLGGYENWYFPEARIIHYKGESTKKSSVNYVFVFYNAMAIFAKKHFTRKRPDLFAGLINLSIYLSAAGAIVSRFLRGALLPLLDALVLLGASMLYWRIVDMDMSFANAMWLWGTLSAVCMVAIALFGGYDRPVRLSNVVKGLLTLASVVVITYALMGRFGQGNIEPLGWISWIGCWLFATRYGLHLLRVKEYSLRKREQQRILCIGSAGESKEALALLWQTHFGLGRQEHMEAEDAMFPDAVETIRRKIRKQGIDEVVFCAKDLAWGHIIELMERLDRTDVMFKIAQPAREFIIGPSSIESVQDLLILEEYSVNSAAARRRKRVFDLVASLLLVITLPIGIWRVRGKSSYLRNIVRVIAGRRSWVGYVPAQEKGFRLPRIRYGVLDPVHADRIVPTALTVRRVNLSYAKDYRVLWDLRLVWRGFAALGNQIR